MIDHHSISIECSMSLSRLLLNDVSRYYVSSIRITLLYQESTFNIDEGSRYINNICSMILFQVVVKYPSTWVHSNRRLLSTAWHFLVDIYGHSPFDLRDKRPYGTPRLLANDLDQIAHTSSNKRMKQSTIVNSQPHLSYSKTNERSDHIIENSLRIVSI